MSRLLENVEVSKAKWWHEGGTEELVGPVAIRHPPEGLHFRLMYNHSLGSILEIVRIPGEKNTQIEVLPYTCPWLRSFMIFK